MERLERFQNALKDLIFAGEEWECEIEREVETLGSEEVSDFIKQAGRSCSLLSGIVCNLLIDIEVRLPVKDAARKANRRRAA